MTMISKIEKEDYSKAGIGPVLGMAMVVALLMGGLSLVGLLKGQELYPVQMLRLAFQASDAMNLVIGLPILLAASFLTLRGRLIGLLCLPGALLYAVYVYLPYAIGLPFGSCFLAYVLIICLSLYGALWILASIKMDQVAKRLGDRAPTKSSGVVLFLLALLTLVRQSLAVFGAVSNPGSISSLKIAEWLSDFLLAGPAWLLGAVFLWRRSAVGLLLGTALLLLGTMLFFGVALVIAWPAIQLGTRPDLAGIGIVLVSGLCCLLPLLGFLRALRPE